MIFIDDSNVWIEAQKFVASGNSHIPKLQDSNRDPRLRIDIGKLVERLSRNRTQGPLFLYSSRLPLENKFDRAYSSKEKRVDNFMSVDIATEATELQTKAKFMAKHCSDFKATKEKDKTIFIVVTNNRNMRPAIKRVLECEIRVELWAWKSGISQVYLDLAAINSLLSVHLLDSIFKDI